MFKLQNLSAANVLKMKGQATREMTDEEFKNEAAAVIMAMQPQATHYRAGVDARGQSISMPARQSAAPSMKVYVQNEKAGWDELSVSDLQALCGETIAAARAKKIAAKKARAEKRASR